MEEPVVLKTENESGNVLVQLMREINRAWSGGHPEKLNDYFHEDIIIVSPDLTVLGEGRDACVRSYQDFVSSAGILDYREYDFDARVWTNTAVITYTYDIAWESEGKSFQETGKDLFAFTRKNGRWQAVWRKRMPKST